MSSQPVDNGNGYHTIASVKEFFTRWLIDIEKFLEERDRRYDERFDAIERARESAFASQKQLTDAAFSASQKAVDKAEQAQKEYNARSNEFRDALNDANKNNIGRDEYHSGHQSLIDRLDADAIRLQEKFDDIKKSIEDLKISKANVSGKSEQSKADNAVLYSTVSLIGTLIAIIAVIITLAKSFIK